MNSDDETDVISEEEEPVETCANCGREQNDWSGTRGQGSMKDGTSYCCEGCADGIGCTCEELDDRGSEAEAMTPPVSQEQPSGLSGSSDADIPKTKGKNRK